MTFWYSSIAAFCRWTPVHAGLNALFPRDGKVVTNLLSDVLIVLFVREQLCVQVAGFWVENWFQEYENTLGKQPLS